MSIAQARPLAVDISNAMLRVTLADGRIIATPLDWYPRLIHATPEQLWNYSLSAGGVHWEDLDEDLSIVGMLQGNHAPTRKVAP
jgi:hypothetical protein